jgi:hypothetical protein
MPTCPYCAEPIAPRLRVCPHCDSDLEEVRRAPARRRTADDAGLRMILPVGRSGWAIAAGYLGLISVLLVPAPFAVLCAIFALVHLKKNPKLHGMGRAIFGLVMGAIGTLVLVIVLIVFATQRPKRRRFLHAADRDARVSAGFSATSTICRAKSIPSVRNSQPSA